MALKFPESCFCLSLKAVSTTIGLLMLAMSALFFQQSLVSTIVYVYKRYEQHQGEEDASSKAIYDLLDSLAYEYGSVQQIVFSGILVYGSIMEKGSMVISWVVLEATVLIYGISKMMIYWRSIFTHPTDFIFLFMFFAGVFVVYCFYRTIQKSVQK